MHSSIRWIAGTTAVFGGPALVAIAAAWPAWFPATETAAVLISGSAAALLYTGRRQQPYPRASHAHARAARVTPRQLLQAGVPAAGFMIAVGLSDPGRLRVLDYCGAVLLITCVTALALRWRSARRAGQISRSDTRRLAELGQRQAWTDQELGAIRRTVRLAFQHAERDVPDVVGEHGTRRRHLRPVQPPASDGEPGPRQAVSG